MNKKLLLIGLGSSLVVGAAIVGVSVSVINHRHSSNSNINKPENIPSTPETKPDSSDKNPESNPVDSTIASNSLTGYYNLTFENTITIISTDTLNAYLTSGLKLENLGGSVSNVKVTYVPKSANYENSTFQVLLTPNEGYSWSDGTNTRITKTLTIKVSDAKNDSSIPENDTLTVDINIGNTSGDDSDMQNAIENLANNSKNKNISDYLNNYLSSQSKYSNVNISIISNSSHVDKKTFDISATPKLGHTWSDGSSNSKIITVSINNVISKWDSSVTRTLDTFTGKLDSYNNQLSFSNAIVNFMNNYSQNISDYLANGSSSSTPGYFNVQFKYSPNSADFNSKSFKLLVSPQEGHAWCDGSTSEKTITVYVS